MWRAPEKQEAFVTQQPTNGKRSCLLRVAVSMDPPVRGEGAISVWWPIHKGGRGMGLRPVAWSGLLPSVCGLTEEEMFIWRSSLPNRSQWTVASGRVQCSNPIHFADRDHAVLNQQNEGLWIFKTSWQEAAEAHHPSPPKSPLWFLYCLPGESHGP